MSHMFYEVRLRDGGTLAARPSEGTVRLLISRNGTRLDLRARPDEAIEMAKLLLAVAEKAYAGLLKAPK